jgi:hypothetical protein
MGLRTATVPVTNRPYPTQIDDDLPETAVTVSAKRGSGKFRVLEQKLVSWKAQMVMLRKDKIVSDESGGPGYVNMLREQGVKLEEV